MRDEDHWDSRQDSLLDLTPEQATEMRREYEADQAAKAEARRRNADEWNRQLARIRNAVARGETAWQREELAADMAWARSVLVDGETFHDGAALYLALYTAKKSSLGRSLATSEVNRLRRVLLSLWPEYDATRAGLVEQGVA